VSGARRTLLLNDVCELVREQLSAFDRPRSESAFAEHDMRTNGVRLGVESLRRARGWPIGVNLHCTEVVPEPPLHVFPQRGRERFPTTRYRRWRQAFLDRAITDGLLQPFERPFE